MNFLKTVFPLSFRFNNNLVRMIIGIIAYAIVGAVVGWAISIVVKLPIISIFGGLLGGLLEIYVVAGIVLLVLSWLKILK